MDKFIEFRIDSLLKQISVIENDLNNLTFDEFAKSDLLVRATCFSISQIGEQMNKLETELKAKYPDLPWGAARKMRNLIVHVYHRVDAKEVYETATKDLPILKEQFLSIKKNIVA
ncbi:MAG: DUF86 domain-containing protein [Bacilli bacterium]|nr:DUF86 domain-containing protein [Bacilli bacterium]